MEALFKDLTLKLNAFVYEQYLHVGTVTLLSLQQIW